MPSRGLNITSLPDHSQAAKYLLSTLYQIPPLQPVISKTNPKIDRNVEIRRLYAAGWSVPKLSREFGISKPRVYQILNNRRK